MPVGDTLEPTPDGGNIAMQVQGVQTAQGTPMTIQDMNNQWQFMRENKPEEPIPERLQPVLKSTNGPMQPDYLGVINATHPAYTSAPSPAPIPIQPVPKDIFSTITSGLGSIISGAEGFIGGLIGNKPEPTAPVNLPAPFISSPQPVSVNNLPAPFLSSLTPAPKEENLLQNSMRTSLSSIPGIGIPLGIASDTLFSIINKKPEQLPFAETSRSISKMDLGGLYENFNKELSPYTTDILGIGRTLEKTPDIDLKKYGDTSQMPYSDIINFGKGLYVGASQHPLDIAATFVGGEVLGLGKGLASQGIARAAASENILLKTSARAASSPLNVDLFNLAEKGVGLYILGDMGKNILNEPTATKKGEATGRGLIQLMGFGTGYSNYKPPEIINPFEGKSFFSGKSTFRPSEILRQDISAKLNSYDIPAEHEGAREAYTNIPKIFRSERFTEPQPGITETSPAKPYSEIDLSIIQSIGKERAPIIKEALSQEPHVVLGSSVMETQRTGLPTGEKIRGPPHDLDIRVNSEEHFGNVLKSLGETTSGMDIKPFEEGYVNIPGRTNIGDNEGIKTISWGTRLFGEPIRNKPGEKLPLQNEILLAGRDFKGVISNEKYNPQMARKAQAIMQDMLPASKKVGNPEARALNEQFRIAKDYYDFQSIDRDLIAGNLQSKGKLWNTPTKSTKLLDKMENTKWNFDFIPQEDNPIIGAKKDIPFKKTLSFKDIKENYEAAIKEYRSQKSSGIKRELEYDIEPEREPSPMGSIEKIFSSSSSASKYISPSILNYIKPNNILSSISSSDRSSISKIISLKSISPKSIPSSKLYYSISPSSYKPPSSKSITSSIIPSPDIISPPSPSSKPSSSSSPYSTKFSFSGSIPSPSPSSKPPYSPPSRYSSPPLPPIGLPGGGGGSSGGSYGSYYQKRVINPFRELKISSGNFRMNLISPVGATPVKKGNVKVGNNKIKMPDIKKYRMNSKVSNKKVKQNNYIDARISDLINSKIKNRKGKKK